MYYATAIKLLFAMLIGGVIGFERQTNNRPAGLKTHILVTLGATLVMILSLEGFEEGDPARMAAQVVSGVGFLGAGTILVRGKSVYGLTTAASLWISACMGLAIGAGFFVEVLMTLAVVLFSLGPLNFLKKKLLNESMTTTLNIHFSNAIDFNKIYGIITDLGIELEMFEIDKENKTLMLRFDSEAKKVSEVKQGILKVESVIGFEKVVME